MGSSSGSWERSSWVGPDCIRPGSLRATGAMGDVRVRVLQGSDPALQESVEKGLKGVPRGRVCRGGWGRLQASRRNWDKATAPGDRGGSS